ncbi:MAG: HEPN domain-containing protein [Bacillota bacterium]
MPHENEAGTRDGKPKTPKTEDMARGLYQQAQSSIESARQALRDGHWAYAVRTSQDASELSLKALLLTAGSDPPKAHDLEGTLKRQRDRLRVLGLAPAEVDAMAEAAGRLADDRSRALYGDERRDIPPSKLYNQGEASRALEAAERIHRRCGEVMAL